MVFTIVTVIFLPLSFLATFFATNVKEFPLNNSGEQEMSLAYGSKYVFGVGVIIAFLCVAVAWSAEQIALWSEDVTVWAWNRLSWLGVVSWRKAKQKASKEAHRRTAMVLSNDADRASYEANSDLRSRIPTSQLEDLERGEKFQRSETRE